MKSILIILGLIVIPYGFNLAQDNRSIIEKMEAGEIIYKKELNKYLPKSLNKYNDKFKATGDVARTDLLFAGILEGIKNDTIYNILLVFRKGGIISFKELPKSTFYYKNGIIIEEFILGRIYTGYDSEKCIKAWFETVEPLKIDTMSNMYQFRMCRIKTSDSLLYCK